MSAIFSAFAATQILRGSSRRGGGLPEKCDTCGKKTRECNCLDREFMWMLVAFAVAPFVALGLMFLMMKFFGPTP